MNIRFEAVLMPQPRAILHRFYQDQRADYVTIMAGIHELERDPDPPADQRAPIYLLNRIVDPSAYVCGDWRISFHLEDDAFLVVDWIVQVDPQHW